MILQDQIKRNKQRSLSQSSDKISLYVNKTRESYSIFQRFREEAISKKTNVSNKNVFEL